MGESTDNDLQIPPLLDSIEQQVLGPSQRPGLRTDIVRRTFAAKNEKKAASMQLEMSVKVPNHDGPDAQSRDEVLKPSVVDDVQDAPKSNEQIADACF